MALHSTLTKNHRLENWVYANEAARLAASGLVSGDVGKIAFQTDTSTYWRLTATTPTWALIQGYPASGVISSGASKNIDWSLYTTWEERLLAANSTFTHINMVDGKVIIIPVRNTTDDYTLNWVGVDYWQGTGGSTPVQSVGDVVDVWTFICLGDKVYGSVAPGI